MSETVIKIENLSKEYRLGQVGTGTLSHDLNRWWHKVRGKEDPYLMIGETNDRAHKGESDYVYALKDINLEVKRGEVLGIIGKNGSGKSTLLKALSKVTGPTTGIIKSKGRIASLLEVGTGFHPELTGRENIYMNGTIMGMTRKEIDSKLDEIIRFSGVERYLDTPTKRYSSGMTVRLGFAVAAHLEPDILVVDEVLAVGDAEFQKKAIGKMKEVSESGGRTVLLVSHNMSAIQNLCDRVVVLDQGQVSFNGDTKKGVEYYLSENVAISPEVEIRENSVGEAVSFTKAILMNSSEETCSCFKVGEPWSLNLYWKVRYPAIQVYLGIGLYKDGVKIRIAGLEIKNIEEGMFKTVFSEKHIILNTGTYTLNIGFSKGPGKRIHFVKDAISFKISDIIEDSFKSKNFTPNSGLLLNEMDIFTKSL